MRGLINSISWSVSVFIWIEGFFMRSSDRLCTVRNQGPNEMLTAAKLVPLAAILAVAGCGQKTPPSESVSVTASSLSGCQAATASVEYGNLLIVPDETKTLIESYRSAWKEFCKTEKQGRPSLADLLVQAKEIEMRFDKIFETYHASRKSSEPPGPEGDAVSVLVVKKFPSFIPAFEGSYFEYEYFQP